MANYTLTVDYLTILDFKEAIAKQIRRNVELNKIMGIKYGFYDEDKRLAEAYKTICKTIQNKSL